MKQTVFHLFFWAILSLSAASCFSTKGYHLNNQNEWAKSPNIDSLAFEALMDAENIWSQPELFEPIGFSKFSTAGGDFIINKTDKATVQIDFNFDGTTAEVTFLYSGWQGHWMYAQGEDGWQLVNKFYSSRFVPAIDEYINPMIQWLNTAALRSDLAWLTEFVGEEIEAQDATVIYHSADSPVQRKFWADQVIEQSVLFEERIKAMQPDTTYIDSEGWPVEIFFLYGLRFETNWSQDHSLRLCMISDTASGLNSMLYEILEGDWHGQVWKQTNKNDVSGQWRNTDETWNYKVSEDRQSISTDNDYPPHREMAPIPETGQQLQDFLGKLEYLNAKWSESVTLDATMMDSDSVVWDVTYTTDPQFDWTWEYLNQTTPTSGSVYYFDAAGNCLRGSHISYQMEFAEMKETTPTSTTKMKIVRFSGNLYELDCLSTPPIPFEKTGLK
ncbi:MAG: hypothetical protein KBC12_03545 [Candidatus Pacebacteria bacterium]|nr:hypothetical protein [Candidatus Paceibacterota bacterium]MBP9851263.1 hypothetical protein [Candidatus Paceibacterota bacterium]